MRTQGSDRVAGLFSGALGGRDVRKCLGDLTEDELQNELILIVHHLDDADEGLGKGDVDYAKASLKDIREVVDRLKQYLSPGLAEGVEGVSE